MLMTSLMIGLLMSVSSFEVDTNTFSNYQDIAITHIHLEWLLDLDDHYINATAQYDFQVTRTLVYVIDLDVQKIPVEYVYYSKNGKILPFQIIDKKEQSELQGDILRITLDRAYAKGETLQIRIRYSVTDKSRAIGFLYPNQTDSKTTPYLYSYCQDNKCRSMIPLQDTPSRKQTLSASVLVKDDRLVVFMTGKSLTQNYPLMHTYDKAYKQYNFRLDIAIPSYLFAIVAGNLESRQVGLQTGIPCFVICEVSCIEKSAKELEDLQSYVNSLATYIGAYDWGEYKIVIMPPSFPLGGMEHPLLTFASPTIIVGDKSGVGTAIHEIGHSWTGNTVTCNNWSNMWINEGFCTFLERKILGQLYGQNSIKLDAYLGNNSMWQQMNTYGLDNSFSSLHPNTTDQDPDDSVSQVPYDKGYQLLLYLETLFGEAQFQAFLKAYIINFKWQSIDEEDLYQFLLSWVRKSSFQNKPEILTKIQVVYKDWVYKTGLPPVILDFSTPEYLDAIALADDWIKGITPDNLERFNAWKYNQKSVTLSRIEVNFAKLTPEIYKAIDDAYKLSESQDVRLQYRWFIGCVKGKYLVKWDLIDTFLGSIGARGWLVNMYKNINLYDPERAQSTYKKHRYFYHPSASYAVDKEVFGIGEGQISLIQ